MASIPCVLDLYSMLMDLPAEVFLDTIRHIYQERSVWRSKLTAHSRPVDFAAIRSTALMTVEGEYDDIAAPGQTRRAHELCPAVPTHFFTATYGVGGFCQRCGYS